MENRDWSGFKELWGESSLLFKITTIIGFFLTLSSITSLADVIFSWKGFIKDGVDFYRTTLILPVTENLKNYGLSISTVEADCLVVYSIYSVSQIRGIWWLIDKNKLLISIPIVFFLGFNIYGFYLASTSNFPDKSIWFFILAFGLVTFYPLVHLTKDKRIEYLKPIAYVVIFILILAAINKGLTTPIA